MRLRIETPLAFEDAHVRVSSLCASDGLTVDQPMIWPSGMLHGWARFGDVRLCVLRRQRRGYTETLVVRGKITERPHESTLTLWVVPSFFASVGVVVMLSALLAGAHGANEPATPLGFAILLYLLLCGGFLLEAVPATRAICRVFG